MIQNGNDRHARNAALWLFLIGVFSQTQVSLVGKIGISEFAMACLAPFVFISNIPIFKRDGLVCFFWLLFLWLAGAVFVDVYTRNYFPFMLKGIAVPITLFANFVCIYVLLRHDLNNLKWLLLGIAISSVVSIFFFQRGIAGELASAYGMEAGVEKIVGYKLFWVSLLTTWLTLPITGWYQKVPKVYSIFALLFLAAFNLASGGRSAFLVAAMSVLLVTFAGKTRESLQFIKRHMGTMLVLLCVFGGAMKVVYEYAATHGFMGVEEKIKYEKSSEEGSSALHLLLDSRGGTFIGLFAALDKPILGHGSVAIDDYGYALDFFLKYGSLETYKNVEEKRLEFGAHTIPAHSHIINFWMWHGIFGLVFWLYVIALALKTLFSGMHIYPPWFGYLAVTIPAFLWDVLFSPLGLRVNTATLFAVMFYVANIKRDESEAPVLWQNAKRTILRS